MKNGIKIEQRITIGFILLAFTNVLFFSEQLFDGIKTTKAFYLNFLIFGFCIIVTIKKVLDKKKLKIRLNMIDGSFIIFVLYSIIRLATSNTFSFLNFDFLFFISSFIFYLIVRSSFFQHKQINIFLLYLLLLGYLEIIISFFQLLGVIEPFSQYFPISGTFDNPSEFCLYLTLVLPVVFLLIHKYKDENNTGLFIRISGFIYVILWLFIVLIIGSRTSLIAGIIGCLFFIIVKYNIFKQIKHYFNSRFKIGLLIGFSFGLILLFFIFLIKIKQQSANGRLLIWTITLDAVKDKPIFGYGYNAFQAKYNFFQAKYFMDKQIAQEKKQLANNMVVAMNDYVETTFNLGLSGLVLYLFILFSVFIFFIHRREIPSDYITLSLSIVIIFAISSFFYYSGKIIPFKMIFLFFIAYISSNNKNYLIYIDMNRTIKWAVLVLLLFSLSSVLLFHNYSNLIAYKYCKESLNYQRYGYNEKALSSINKSYPVLKNYGLFLYVYCTVLYENGLYNKCINISKEILIKNNSSKLYILIGDSYLKKMNYQKAETCYEFASYIVPNNFGSRYKLFNLYKEWNKPEKALVIAKEIITKKIKIDSYKIQDMIKKCNNFIKKK